MSVLRGGKRYVIRAFRLRGSTEGFERAVAGGTRNVDPELDVKTAAGHPEPTRQENRASRAARERMSSPSALLMAR